MVSFMSKKLFGNNIKPDCGYCDNYNTEGENGFCEVKKEIKKGKCRKFIYNPTLRVPNIEAKLMQFSKEDFEI